MCLAAYIKTGGTYIHVRTLDLDFQNSQKLLYVLIWFFQTRRWASSYIHYTYLYVHICVYVPISSSIYGHHPFIYIYMHIVLYVKRRLRYACIVMLLYASRTVTQSSNNQMTGPLLTRTTLGSSPTLCTPLMLTSDRPNIVPLTLAASLWTIFFGLHVWLESTISLYILFW